MPADTLWGPIAYTSGGATLLCSGNIIDQETGAIDRLIDIYYPLDGLEVSPDGKYLVTQHGESGHLFDARTGRVLQTFLNTNTPSASASASKLRANSFPPDDNTEPYRYSSIMRSHQPIHFPDGGEQIIIGRGIYDVGTGQRSSALSRGEGNRWVSAHSPDWYYTSYYNNDIAELRSYDDGSVIRRLTLPETGGSSAVATSSSGQLIATTGYYYARTDYVDSRIMIWSSTNGEVLTTLPNISSLPFRLRFSKDERLVASGADLNNPEAAVWDIPNRRQLLSLRDRVSPALGFDLLPDSRTLAYGIIDRLEFWDARTSNRVAIVTNEASFITAVAAAPDGKTVYVGRMDGTLVAYKTPPLDPIDLNLSPNTTTALTFNGRDQVTYQVQLSTNLNSWTTLTNVTGADQRITIPLPPDGKRFFRLN